MAFILKDRVQETTTTTGTGNITLAGAASGGFRAFSAVMANNDTTYYCIQDTTNSAWEVGLGTWTTGGILVRTSVLASSNANALVSFAAGTKQVFMTYPGDRNVVVQVTNNTLSALLPTNTTDPSTPAAGFMHVYAKSVAGRPLLRTFDSDGMDYSMQPHCGFNRVSYTYPTTGAAIGTDGDAAVTTLGTLSTPTIASTNLVTQTRRTLFTTATAASSMAGMRHAQNEFWRGNAAGLGGFFVSIRFAIEATGAGHRGFFGVWDTPGTAPTNVNPLTTTTPGKIGVAYDLSTSNNLQLVTNVSGTAPTVTDLGTNFPANDTTKSLELILYCPPNSTTVQYRVVNLTSNLNTAGNVGTTNLPSNTTFLAPCIWVTNNANGIAAAASVSRLYFETDF